MKALVGFELQKLLRSRTIPYILGMTLALPSIYVLALALNSLGIVSSSRLPKALKLLAPLHTFNGYVVYMMCLLNLLSEVWVGESRSRTLETLVLTQVSRVKILLAKCVAVWGSLLVCSGCYFTLFLAASFLVFAGSSAEQWRETSIVLGESVVMLGLYFLLFGGGLLCWTLLGTLLVLVTGSVWGAIGGAAALLVSFHLARALFPALAPLAHLFFFDAYRRILDLDTLQSAFCGGPSWLDLVSGAPVTFICNALGLFVLAAILWDRVEFNK